MRLISIFIKPRRPITVYLSHRDAFGRQPPRFGPCRPIFISIKHSLCVTTAAKPPFRFAFMIFPLHLGTSRSENSREHSRRAPYHLHLMGNGRAGESNSPTSIPSSPPLIRAARHAAVPTIAKCKPLAGRFRLRVKKTISIYFASKVIFT